MSLFSLADTCSSISFTSFCKLVYVPLIDAFLYSDWIVLMCLFNQSESDDFESCLSETIVSDKVTSPVPADAMSSMLILAKALLTLFCCALEDLPVSSSLASLSSLALRFFKDW